MTTDEKLAAAREYATRIDAILEYENPVSVFAGDYRRAAELLRFAADYIADQVAPDRQRIAELEAQVKRLRSTLQDIDELPDPRQCETQFDVYEEWVHLQGIVGSYCQPGDIWPEDDLDPLTAPATTEGEAE